MFFVSMFIFLFFIFFNLGELILLTCSDSRVSVHRGVLKTSLWLLNKKTKTLFKIKNIYSEN